MMLHFSINEKIANDRLSLVIHRVRLLSLSNEPYDRFIIIIQLV